MTEKIKNSNPVIILKTEAQKIDFSDIRAGQDNKLANSGETMFLDLQRMNFIINGKKIDRNLLLLLKGGADNLKLEDCLSKILSEDLTTDTDQKEPKELKDLKHLKFFYDIGKNNAHLLPKHSFAMEVFNDLNRISSEKYGDLSQKYKKIKDKNDDYRPFVKEFFKEIFKYAGAEVPHDSILEELITNCNQAGYESGLYLKLACIFNEYDLIIGSPEKKININCVNPSYLEIKSDMDLPIFKYKNPEKEMCSLTSELKFTLESNEQESDKNVTYKDGKLLLTVPNKLKNYMIGEKNLFDVIKGYFEVFCRKLGFNFEIKIEHNFTEPSANGHLEEVKQPMQSINQKENYKTTTWYVG